MNDLADYKFHPVADLFPLLRDTDPQRWFEFCASIREEGLLEPIIVHEGTILDGRNRFLACIETQKPPRFVEFNSLGISVDPHLYAFDRNFHRRDLTDDMRAAIYQSFFEYEQQEALRRRNEVGAQALRQRTVEGKNKGGRKQKPENQVMTKSSEVDSDDNDKQPAPTSRAKLAEAADVSEYKAQQVINVAKEDKELLKQVQSGEKKLNEAAKEVKERKRQKPVSENVPKPKRGTKAAVKVIVALCLRVEQDIEAAVALVPKKDRQFVASSLAIFADRLHQSMEEAA